MKSLSPQTLKRIQETFMTGTPEEIVELQDTLEALSHALEHIDIEEDLPKMKQENPGLYDAFMSLQKTSKGEAE